MLQSEAFNILKTGANAFLTGEPGSGKTHTINTFVQYLREHGIEPAITASTGIAATHIGGMTIHAWSGIGIRTHLTEYDIDTIMQNERTVRRVRRAHVLIIDEVSMLSATTLSMIDAVCRAIRGSNNAFGGLQTILVGDFFQLPPIIRNNANNQESLGIDVDIDYDEIPRTHFAYDSPTWKTLNPIICYLSEQHRQDDTDLLEVLSAIRHGTIQPKHKEALAIRKTEKVVPHDVTQLFSHNADVDLINNTQLAATPGDSRHFAMQTHGGASLVAGLIKTCLSPENLELKIGARVMFTKNDPAGAYVNGTTGIVTAFRSDSYPVIETSTGWHIDAEPTDWSIDSDGRILARITQLPLRLAWAITVHKSQGMSLDSAVIDLSRAFEYGQGYVALSRVRTLEGILLLGINDRAYEVHPSVCNKDIELREQSKAASETFGAMSETTLSKLQKSFIDSCGGTHKILSKKPSVLATKKSTYEITHELLSEHKKLEDIAKARSLTISTIISHLEKLCSQNSIKLKDIAHLLPFNKKAETEIHKSFSTLGAEKLRTVYEDLKEKHPFEHLRLARITFINKK